MSAPAGPPLHAEFDDLEIVSPASAPGEGLPLCAVVRNEMYFLPAFLDHYRRVGVGHFIVVDDQSDDGTGAFLGRQPDVTLMGSPRRYGDLVVPRSGPGAGREIRMELVWKSLLPARFAPDRWSVLADADEFVVLPPEVGLPEVAARADRIGARCVTGVMLDVYPRRIEAFEREGPFDLAGEWFFDGERHLQLREGRDPRVLHPGARARLMAELGLARWSFRDRLNRLTGKRRYPRYNMLQKPFLRKWGVGDSMRDAHRSTLAPTTGLLLPLRHFKFNADSYRRIADAVATGQYLGGSHEYVALDRVLEEMKARDHPFLYRRSREAGSYENYAATGNALLGPAPPDG